MNELIVRDPNIIASEIQTIKTQTKTVVLAAAMEIGKRLNEVKAMLPHGTWGTWLHDNVDYSERTAQNLMAVYNEYSGMPSAAIDGISYSKAVALLGIASEDRMEAIEGNDIEAMTTSEVEELARQLREEKEKSAGMQLQLDLLQGADEREKQALEAKAAAEKERDRKDRECKKAKAEADKEKRRVAELENAEPPAPVVVEKIPADIQAELTRLQGIAAKAPSAPVIRFRQAYEDFQMKAVQIIECIKEIEKEDPETAGKYRGAVKTACQRITDQLDADANP